MAESWTTSLWSNSIFFAAMLQR
uniref:Uncharacterized protein n=1 Tax=Arundo donax TaxID=35708 RepID=A0A0A9DR96_ARUDO